MQKLDEEFLIWNNSRKENLFTPSSESKYKDILSLIMKCQEENFRVFQSLSSQKVKQKRSRERKNTFESYQRFLKDQYHEDHYTLLLMNKLENLQRDIIIIKKRLHLLEDEASDFKPLQKYDFKYEQSANASNQRNILMKKIIFNNIKSEDRNYIVKMQFLSNFLKSNKNKKLKQHYMTQTQLKEEKKHLESLH